MGLIWADGFDQWGGLGQAVASGYYTFGDGCNITTNNPRTGGWSYQNGDNYNGGALNRILDTSLNSGCVGIAVDTTVSIVGKNCGITLMDNGNNGMFYGGFSDNNTATIAKADGTILAQTAANVYVPNSYNYLTLSFNRNTVTNNWDLNLYREKTQILQVLGVPGPAAPVPRISLGSRRASSGGQGNWAPATTYLDDFYVNDDPTFLGPMRCRTQFMSANGANQDWVPTGVASAYQALANVPPDAAKYLSGAVGAVSSFGINPIPTNTSYIMGVMMIANLAKSDAGTCAVQLGVDSGGSIAMSADIAPGTGYATYNKAFNQDPAGGGKPWTYAAINAMLARIVRTS